MSSLNALEGESLRQFTMSFKDLSASQQDEVLYHRLHGPSLPTQFSDAAEGDQTPGCSHQPPSLRDYFEHLKGWISMAYYSSEVGMKELGWTARTFLRASPAANMRAVIPDRPRVIVQARLTSLIPCGGLAAGRGATGFGHVTLARRCPDDTVLILAFRVR